MKLQSWAIVLSIAAAAFWVAQNISGDEPARQSIAPDAPADSTTTREDNTSTFMRGKLISSQQVLEGLVKGDCDLIKQGAEQMRTMGEAAEWQRDRDPVYEHYSGEFRRQAGKLARLADEGNLEGASFTYLHITTTCISCHEHVRDVIRISDDATTRKEPVEETRKGPRLKLRR